MGLRNLCVYPVPWQRWSRAISEGSTGLEPRAENPWLLPTWIWGWVLSSEGRIAQLLGALSAGQLKAWPLLPDVGGLRRPVWPGAPHVASSACWACGTTWHLPLPAFFLPPTAAGPKGTPEQTLRLPHHLRSATWESPTSHRAYRLSGHQILVRSG